MFYYGQSFLSSLVRVLFPAVLFTWQLQKCLLKRTPPQLSRFHTKIIQLLTNMKEKLIEYLSAAKKHWLEQQQKATDALALIEYEIECVKNFTDPKTK